LQLEIEATQKKKKKEYSYLLSMWKANAKHINWKILCVQQSN